MSDDEDRKRARRRMFDDEPPARYDSERDAEKAMKEARDRLKERREQESSG